MPELVFIPPVLNYDERQVAGALDSYPSTLEDGGELQVGDCLENDAGDLLYWTGSVWRAVTAPQVALLQLQLLTQIRDLLADDDEE